ANARFLERTIARGDAIELPTRDDRINPDPNNYFRREQDVLESHGYRVADDGWRRLPPETPPRAPPAPPAPGARGATSTDASPTGAPQDAAGGLRTEAERLDQWAATVDPAANARRLEEGRPPELGDRYRDRIDMAPEQARAEADRLRR